MQWHIGSLRVPRIGLAVAVGALLVVCTMPAAVAGPDDPPDTPGGAPDHHVVFREDGRNPGWAAAVGKMYRWDNELLFAFYDYKYLDDPRTANEHNTDDSIPTPVKLARSLDGGATWSFEYPKYPGARAGVLDLFEDPGAGPAPVDPPGGIDFTDPNFAMVVRVTANCTSVTTCRNPNGNRPFTRYHNNYDGPTGARSWFVYTTDRGRTWSPRYWLPAAPDLGPYFGVRARTDYIVNGPNEMQLFMAVDATQEVERGVLERGVISIRTTDGGRTWTRDGEMTPFEPGQQRIMPSTVRIDEDTLVSAVRDTTFSATGMAGSFEVYRSDDNGATWTYLNTPVEFGPSTSPPSMVLTDDGHLVLTYGNRTTRQLEAIVSTDAGSTWGEVVVGRTGAAHFDISYPRSVVLANGDIVTAYHWNDPETSPTCDQNDDDEPTYVATTTWNPVTYTTAPEPPVFEPCVPDEPPTTTAVPGTTTTKPPTTTSPASTTGVPSVPKNVRATAATRTSITVAWNPSSRNPAGYHVFRNGVLVATVEPSASPNLTDTGLERNTKYNYRIRGFNAAGNGPLSPAKGLRTKF
jgi:hypothetical protein